MKHELKPVKAKDVASLSSIFSDYFPTKSTSHSFENQIKLALTNNQLDGFALYGQRAQAVGVVFANKSLAKPDYGYVRFLHVYSSVKQDDHQSYENSEYRLFDAVFRHLKETCTTIKFDSHYKNPSDTLQNYLVKQGFQRIVRIDMVVHKSDIETLVEPELPLGYELVPWNKEMKTSTAKLLVEINDQSIDNLLLPFFTTIGGCERFIQDMIDNSFGGLGEECTRVLTYNKEPIGVCFLTRISSDTINVPEVGILPAHRRKGLGKALVIHSFSNLLATNPDSSEISLAVTFDNIGARKLYESLGFKQTKETIDLIWQNHNN